MLWATVARKDFALQQGELAYFAASDAAQRGYCAHCHSPITFEHKNEPEVLDVNALLLDNVDKLRPEYHCHMASNPSWFALTDNLAQFKAELP